MSDPDDAAESAPPDLDRDAVIDAVARARRSAQRRGLRPGGPLPRRRRRDNPTAAAGFQDGRDPRLIMDDVDALISERGWEVDIAAGSVMGRWPGLVGAEIAAHSTPVSFDQGVLVIKADSTAWATQLRMLSSTLLERISSDVGDDVVTQVRVVGPQAPTWKRGPRTVSDGRGPRDTYG